MPYTPGGSETIKPPYGGRMMAFSGITVREASEGRKVTVLPHNIVGGESANAQVFVAPPFATVLASGENVTVDAGEVVEVVHSDINVEGIRAIRVCLWSDNNGAVVDVELVDFFDKQGNLVDQKVYPTGKGVDGWSLIDGTIVYYGATSEIAIPSEKGAAQMNIKLRFSETGGSSVTLNYKIVGIIGSPSPGGSGGNGGVW